MFSVFYLQKNPKKQKPNTAQLLAVWWAGRCMRAAFTLTQFTKQNSAHSSIHSSILALAKCWGYKYISPLTLTNTLRSDSFLFSESLFKFKRLGASSIKAVWCQGSARSLASSTPGSNWFCYLPPSPWLEEKCNLLYRRPERYQERIRGLSHFKYLLDKLSRSFQILLCTPPFSSRFLGNIYFFKQSSSIWLSFKYWKQTFFFFVLNICEFCWFNYLPTFQPFFM